MRASSPLRLAMSSGLQDNPRACMNLHSALFTAKSEDVAVGLGVVQHAVGAAEGLDEAMVLQFLVDVERIKVFAVETGQQHVDDYGDVDFVLCSAWVGFAQVSFSPLLILDPLLNVLVVEVEFLD